MVEHTRNARILFLLALTFFCTSSFCSRRSLWLPISSTAASSLVTSSSHNSRLACPGLSDMLSDRMLKTYFGFLHCSFMLLDPVLDRLDVGHPLFQLL